MITMGKFKFTKTGIEGMFVVEPTVFEDNRGYFMETFQENDFKEAGHDLKFVQDNQSKSSKGVLRGLHLQLNYPQGKLVRVIGVGNLEFEDNYLSLNKEDHKYRAGNSVWIELGEKAISYDEAKEYNGKYVIVEGFFDKDDRGHFDMFCGSIKNISRYQLWEKSDED